ncbi:hypothetical protein JCM11491_005611 [Sporobolomyces phaffii]
MDRYESDGYRQRQEPTDSSSVVSHEGLAALVSSSASSSLPPSFPRSAYHSTPSFDSLPLDPTRSSRYSFRPDTPPSPYPPFSPRAVSQLGCQGETVSRSDAVRPRDEDVGLGQSSGGAFQRGVGYERDDRLSTLRSGQRSGRDGRLDDDERRLAQRIKRLEREFGGPDATKLGDGGEGKRQSVTEGIKAMQAEAAASRRRERETSGVDDHGRLVVPGRKKRFAVRWFQGVGAIVTGFASIGASLLTHAKEKAPPSGTLPLIALYTLPFLSLSVTVYLFVVRPCVFARRRRALRRGGDESIDDWRHGRGRIYPLAYPPTVHSGGGWCDCFGGRGGGRNRVSRGAPPPPHSSINLVIDPSLFVQGPPPEPRTGRDRERSRRKQREKKRRRRRRAAERKTRTDEQKAKRRRTRDSDFDDETDLGPRSSSSSSSSEADDESVSCLSSDDDERDDVSVTHPRSFTSILAHVHLEERWRAARGRVKLDAGVDFVLGLVWGATGAYAVAVGTKCPVGTFGGFCDLYNTAVACSILLSLSFFVALTFDCLDLARTNVSPRHRQQRFTTTTTTTTNNSNHGDTRAGSRRPRGEVVV